MPPSLFSLEAGSRKGYVCRSCLVNLQTIPKYRANAAWLRNYSKSSSIRPPPPARPRATPVRSVPVDETPKISPFEDKDVEVKYFNQEGPGQLTRLRDSEEFNNAFNDMDEDLESTINELTKKLQDTARLVQLMEKYGMKDKAYELKRQYGSRKAIQGSPPDIPDDCWPRGKVYHVGRLNTYLQNAFEDMSKGKITPKIVSSTWKYYSAARKTLSTSWDKVPKEVWELLWQIFSYEKEWNVGRMAHVHVLAKDMMAAGLSLDGPRQLLAIEAMFISGWQKEAIENWKKAASSLGSKPETFKEFWELGVRMCAHSGDLERAERAVDKLFESSHETDPRILIPVIRACAQKEATEEKAWKHYLQLRELLGNNITIEDYDEVIATFLSTNHTELGLQAFVDMMFSSCIDIRGKAKLPSTVGNQFFLGKWLKRLIGAGDLDGAFSVIKYMEAKGILGSAIQINGLIGAWLRTETEENLKKAEELAWAMIRSRLVFVKLRQRQALLEWPLRLTTTDSSEDTGLKFMPRATVETFSLMAENYRRRGLHTEMEKLWEAFGEAEMATNSFMMNQLIESFIQNGEVQKALDFYFSMTREHQIPPDAHTFLVLLKSLSVNRLVAKYDDLVEQDIVMCRQFFHDLVDTPFTFDSEAAFDQLPRSILHSFLKLEDYPGMLAAARAMRELFSFAPSEALLVELAAGSTSLSVPTRRNKKLLMNASRITQSLLEERRLALEKEGRSLENMTPEQKAHELCVVLERLIHYKARASVEQLQPHYEEAAQQMGVFEIVVTRDPEVIARRSKAAVSPSSA